MLQFWRKSAAAEAAWHALWEWSRKKLARAILFNTNMLHFCKFSRANRFFADVWNENNFFRRVKNWDVMHLIFRLKSSTRWSKVNANEESMPSTSQLSLRNCDQLALFNIFICLLWPGFYELGDYHSPSATFYDPALSEHLIKHSLRSAVLVTLARFRVLETPTLGHWCSRVWRSPPERPWARLELDRSWPWARGVCSVGKTWYLFGL